MRYYFEAMQQQHHALPLEEGVLNKVLYREAPSWGPTPYPLKYRKIPKINPGAYIFQRPFLRGLFLEGPILGKAQLCMEGNLHYKISWAWKWNLPFLLCFTLYLRVNSKYKPPGGLYSERRFNGGFFALWFWGAYIWMSLFSEFYDTILTEKVPLSYTFFWQNMVPLSHT